MACALLLCSGIPHLVAAGDSPTAFQVDGIVTVTPFGTDGKPREDITVKQFTIRVADHTWEMTLKLSEATRNYYQQRSSQTGRPFDLPDYDTLTFDGTNLFLFRDMETVTARLRANGSLDNANKSLHENSAAGEVVLLEVPHFSEGDSAVWLAYASAPYFKNHATDRVEVAWPWGVTKDGLLRSGESAQRRAVWNLTTEAPGLPKQICYYANDGNSTNALYWVDSYTHFAGLTLPLSANLEVYLPTSDSEMNTDREKPALQSRYEIRATAFNLLVHPIILPPQLPVLTRIRDRRFGNPFGHGGVHYFSDDRFRSKDELTNNAASIQSTKPAHRESAVEPAAPGGRHYLLIFCLIAPALIFVALTAKSFNRRRK